MSHVVKTQRSNGSPHWLILGSSSFEGPALRQKYNGWQKKSDTPRSRIGIGTELDSRPISISNACIIEHVYVYQFCRTSYRFLRCIEIASIFTLCRNRVDFYFSLIGIVSKRYPSLMHVELVYHLLLDIVSKS